MSSDFPPYTAHGWKYLVPDPMMPGCSILFPVGPPCNVCMTPSGTAQYRHINPDEGLSEVAALGQRNSVGGDDPRTGQLWFSENARDWMGDNIPSDKLNHLTRYGEHFGYPYCHQGDIPDPKYSMGHKCSEFSPPALNVGPHMGPLGMKFYNGNMFPAEYRNNIFLAEHGGCDGRHPLVDVAGAGAPGGCHAGPHPMDEGPDLLARSCVCHVGSFIQIDYSLRVLNSLLELSSG